MQADPKPNNNNPLISIGVPVYNGQNYIDKALKSLLDQTYKNFEIIISDNCSTDNTQAICQSYVKIDNRIKYFRQIENVGLAKNFNYVLREAKGEYFLWTAYDDIRTKDCLQYYINNIGEANAFYSSYSAYNHSLNKSILNFDPPLLSGDVKNRKNDLIIYFNKLCPSMFYGFFRTDLLKTIEFRLVDWSDALLVTQYIKLYGFKTQLSEPKIFFGRDNDNYQIKPYKRFLNPFPFLVGTFTSVFVEGGAVGWLYYSKQMFNMLFVSFKFNLLKR